MREERKFLYCPTCELFPDEIEEVPEKITEERRWNGDCYELIGTMTDYQDSLYFCSNCKTQLEERERGGER